MSGGYENQKEKIIGGNDMTLKDELIVFFNNHVKEYETNVFVNTPIGVRPIKKEEHTPYVVDHLISVLKDHDIDINNKKT